MARSIQRQMRTLFLELGKDRMIPLHQLEHVHRLCECHWAGDIQALAALWRDRPGWVERYLDVMVSVMHQFPDGKDVPAEAHEAGVMDGPSARRRRLGLDP